MHSRKFRSAEGVEIKAINHRLQNFWIKFSINIHRSPRLESRDHISIIMKGKLFRTCSCDTNLWCACLIKNLSIESLIQDSWAQKQVVLHWLNIVTCECKASSNHLSKEKPRITFYHPSYPEQSSNAVILFLELLPHIPYFFHWIKFFPECIVATGNTVPSCQMSYFSWFSDRKSR